MEEVCCVCELSAEIFRSCSVPSQTFPSAEKHEASLTSVHKGAARTNRSEKNKEIITEKTQLLQVRQRETFLVV